MVMAICYPCHIHKIHCLHLLDTLLSQCVEGLGFAGWVLFSATASLQIQTLQADTGEFLWRRNSLIIIGFGTENIFQGHSLTYFEWNPVMTSYREKIPTRYLHNIHFLMRSSSLFHFPFPFFPARTYLLRSREHYFLLLLHFRFLHIFLTWSNILGRDRTWRKL